MRILINQLKNVGDVLLATSAIALVRKKHPDAWISLLTVPRVAPFFQNHPLIDEVISLKYESKKNSLGIMWEMIRNIREKKFDLNISLDNRLRPLLLALLAGIPQRITGDGLDKPNSRRVWFRCLFTSLYPITNQFYEHQTETFMKVVRPFLNLPDTAKELPSLPATSEEVRKKVKGLLGIEEDAPHNKKVLLCVRGTHPEKNWAPEFFAKVIDQTRDLYNSDCYIIGAPGDYDYGQGVVEKCVGYVNNICGKTNAEDLKALCECADLLVSVDTGTGHICATTETPIISIFLCTNPVQWHPLSTKATILCEEFAFTRFGLKPTSDFITHEEILPKHVMKEIRKNLIN